MPCEQKFLSFMTFCAYEVVRVACQSRMGREKKKRDKLSAAQDTFPLCQIDLFGIWDWFRDQANILENKKWIFIFNCRLSRSWSFLLFESASQKYTHCCRNNSEHLSQMNETAYWICWLINHFLLYLTDLCNHTVTLSIETVFMWYFPPNWDLYSLYLSWL